MDTFPPYASVPLRRGLPLLQQQLDHADKHVLDQYFLDRRDDSVAKLRRFGLNKYSVAVAVLQDLAGVESLCVPLDAAVLFVVAQKCFQIPRSRPSAVH